MARFNDCPLCGADIDGLEPDTEMQSLVDKFIEGHGRVHRNNKVLGEKVAELAQREGNNLPGVTASEMSVAIEAEGASLERGSFLMQQAIRVSWLACLCTTYLLSSLLDKEPHCHVTAFCTYTISSLCCAASNVRGIEFSVVVVLKSVSTGPRCCQGAKLVYLVACALAGLVYGRLSFIAMTWA